MIEGLASALKEVSEIAKSKTDIMPDFFKNLEFDKNTDINKPISINELADRSEVNNKNELNEEEKAKLKEETGWSDEIINSISSLEEAEIYKNANLQEAEIGGKKCLIRTDIDISQTDEFGRTNKERMENGQPPITKNGETVELHHIGQKQDSPLAELTIQEHRGKGNDTILHDIQKESEIDRTEFRKEREVHWENRASEDKSEGITL